MNICSSWIEYTTYQSTKLYRSSSHHCCECARNGDGSWKCDSHLGWWDVDRLLQVEIRQPCWLMLPDNRTQRLQMQGQRTPDSLEQRNQILKCCAPRCQQTHAGIYDSESLHCVLVLYEATVGDIIVWGSSNKRLYPESCQPPRWPLKYYGLAMVSCHSWKAHWVAGAMFTPRGHIKPACWSNGPVGVERRHHGLNFCRWS